VSNPRLTALIRCRDEERDIGHVIDVLQAQTIADAIQIVVIDSGSRDATVAEVRRRGIEPMQIRPEDFTYGRALNLAAAEAGAPVCVSISAHALPTDEGWAERVVAAFDDDRVACAFGQRVTPDLRPLREAVFQDAAQADATPFWGYSNSAGAFRRDLWQQRPFREELPASEDLEWALHWQRQGWLVRLDPALVVQHSHDDEWPLMSFKRIRRNRGAVTWFRRVDAPPVRSVLTEWWFGPHLHRSNWRARLDPRRMAKLAGQYAALRWPAR
jgi:rhamnosyltransferase